MRRLSHLHILDSTVDILIARPRPRPRPVWSSRYSLQSKSGIPCQQHSHTKQQILYFGSRSRVAKRVAATNHHRHLIWLLSVSVPFLRCRSVVGMFPRACCTSGRRGLFRDPSLVMPVYIHVYSVTTLPCSFTDRPLASFLVLLLPSFFASSSSFIIFFSFSFFFSKLSKLSKQAEIRV